MLPVGLVGAERGGGGGLAREPLRARQRRLARCGRYGPHGARVASGASATIAHPLRAGNREANRAAAGRVSGGAAEGKPENYISRDNRAYRA